MDRGVRKTVLCLAVTAVLLYLGFIYMATTGGL